MCTPNSMPAAAELIWKASKIRRRTTSSSKQVNFLERSAITSCVRLLIFHHVANDDKSLGNEERWLAWMVQAGSAQWRLQKTGIYNYFG